MRDAFRKWRMVKLHFPIKKYKRLPGASPYPIPRLQHDFSKYHESEMHKAERKRRRDAVKEAFEHSWRGYSKYAWLHDEVKPISGGSRDPFGAWGATLVDSLDTLWIMGMEKEFEKAVHDLRKIDFTRSDNDIINVFETTIRYIGGLLGAYDLTDRKYNVLLHKAIELGEMIFHAFDTPNHMPILHWPWQEAESEEHDQSSPVEAILAELGSMTLEFTRLTQLTGDPKYFDAVQRITDLFKAEQNSTNLPGLWPLRVHPQAENLHIGDTFTMGGQADSLYEYLPKQYLLLQGRDDDYRTMYEFALDTAKNYLAFEPLIPLQSDDDPGAEGKPLKDPDDDEDSEVTKRSIDLEPKSHHKRDYDFSPDYSNPILLGTAHSVSSSSSVSLDTVGQHLSCFAGGMVAMAARTFAPFHRHEYTDLEMDLAERLVAGCVWSYRATPSKIGPEMFAMHPCRKGRAAVSSGEFKDWTGVEPGTCRWNRDTWLKAVRERHASDIDAGELALEESQDPDYWKQWVKEHNLKEGFVDVLDARYMLRPETIESLFVMWRITGDPKFQDQAWEMFEAINRLCKSKYGYAGIRDVMLNPSWGSFGGDLVKRDAEAEDEDMEKRDVGPLKLKSKSGKKKGKSSEPNVIDTMESFWTGETLKYFYLIFAEPSLVSLDEYVFNTEAHPFRWRKGPPPPGVNNG